MQIRNTELKYNLHLKPKHWLKTLGFEAETAISYANEFKQSYLRHAVSKTIRHLSNKNIQNNITAKQEWRTMKDIKKIITEHKLIKTRADKRKTIVVIQKQDYNKIISDIKPVYTYYTRTNKTMPKQHKASHKTMPWPHHQKPMVEIP
jgi:hypothetical protein